jgi:hypothetical protein
VPRRHCNIVIHRDCNDREDPYIDHSGIYYIDYRGIYYKDHVHCNTYRSFGAFVRPVWWNRLDGGYQMCFWLMCSVQRLLQSVPSVKHVGGLNEMEVNINEHMGCYCIRHIQYISIGSVLFPE